MTAVLGAPYVVTVTGEEWISANDHRSWQRRHRLTRQWRTSAAFLCRTSRPGRLDRARIVAYALMPDHRRRDSSNLAPTAKACVDGLVDAGLLVDDDHTRLDGPDMRIRVVPGVRCPTLELHVLAPEAGAA